MDELSRKAQEFNEARVMAKRCLSAFRANEAFLRIIGGLNVVEVVSQHTPTHPTTMR